VADRLDNMAFEERQELLRLVVDRVTVENGTARIDTVIPGPKDDGQLRARRSELVEPQHWDGLGPIRQQFLHQFHHWAANGFAHDHAM